jgi:hypothetical protein
VEPELPLFNIMNSVASDAREADIHKLLEHYHVRYEVRPFYVVSDQRPVGVAPIDQRVQAGFDVNLYGTLEKMQLPLYRSEEARTLVDYFETIAGDIQSKAGQLCTIEVTFDENSVVLDTHEHFQPEAVLRIRISHARGLEQPEGSSEEQALGAIRETLRKLEVPEE